MLVFSVDHILPLSSHHRTGLHFVRNDLLVLAKVADRTHSRIFELQQTIRNFLSLATTKTKEEKTVNKETRVERNRSPLLSLVILGNALLYPPGRSSDSNSFSVSSKSSSHFGKGIMFLRESFAVFASSKARGLFA